MVRYISIFFAWFALTLGAVLTLWGLSHMAWPKVLPFDGSEGLLRYSAFLLIISLLVVIGAMLIRKSPIVIGCVLCVVFVVLSGAVWPLLVTIWFVIASAVLGRFILSVFRIYSSSRSYWIYNFLIGAGIYGTVIGLLAHFPVNYPGLYCAILAAPLVFGWRVCLELIVSIKEWFTAIQPLESNVKWLEMAITVVGLIHFVVALMPELMYDALATHQFVPAHMALRHQWGFDVSTYAWAVMPMLGDWIYTLGYMIGGETTTRLINISFIFVLGRLVRNIVLWAGGTDLGAKWAVLIFLSTPLTFTESSSLFIESIWACFLVVSIFCFLRIAFQDIEMGAVRVAVKMGCLMLGLAIAAKAVTFTMLPLLFLLLAYKTRRLLSKSVIRSTIIGIYLFVLFGAIPYLVSWCVAANPVFPFFNDIFRSPYYPSIRLNNPSFNSGVAWDLPYRVIFDSGRYMEASAGASGFQWILLLFSALIILIQLKNYRGILLSTIGVLSLCITFQFQSYLRYVFPQFIMLTAMMGIVISSQTLKGKLLSRSLTCIAVFTVGLNLLFFTSGTWLYRDFPLKSILSASDRKDYLVKRLPLRNAVDAVNALNTRKAPVAVFGEPKTAGLASDALYINWYNHSWQSAFNAVKTEQDLARLFGVKQVDFFIVDSSSELLSEEQIALLEQVSIKIARFGSVEVCRLKDEYQFQEELLIEPNFTSTTGWSLANGAIFNENSQTITVNVSSPVVQRVAVTGGERYLNAVVARCQKERTQGRIQVNWNDANGKIIEASIEVFNSTADWQEHLMVVTAPLNAVSADVYASGHIATPLEFKSVSFKR